MKFLSPEYFELLRTDPVFARAQQLGWAIAINIGDERIVIEKDGKQQDESLKVKPQPDEVEPGRNQQIPDKRGLNQLPDKQIPFPNKRQQNERQEK